MDNEYAIALVDQALDKLDGLTYLSKMDAANIFLDLRLQLMEGMNDVSIQDEIDALVGSGVSAS